MNFKSISFYLSLFCFPICILALINILYASYFDYFLSVDSYVISLIVSFFFGTFFFLIGRKSNKNISFIEQLILILLVYFTVGFLISFPFYLSNFQITFINAFFESISGLTGTGFSTLKSIKYLDPTLILWRSSSQWIGGLYFLFFLILIFSNKKFNFKMTGLTFSGESSFNSKENLKDNILRIFILYCILSFIILTLFSFSGVRLYNSLNLSMTLISNGGFLPSDNLNEIINTNLQKIILSISFLFALFNFYLIINIFNKKIVAENHREDLFLFILSLILILLIYFNDFDGLDLILSVLSSLTNSGIALIKSDNNLSLFFLFITMIGGSLISNSSGIKLIRFYILLKITSYEIIKLISPNSIINKTIFK